MVLLIALLIILLGAASWLGYRQMFRLELLNQNLVINGFLIAMGVLTLMTIAHWIGVFPQSVAARVTMGVYTFAAGFFFGYGVRLLNMRKEAGDIEYIYRSFWTDIAPNLIAIFLVAYGIYRTGVLTLGPFTGIGITSGLSLVGFGFWGWTVHVVPEFRKEGLLMLDQFVPWKQVLAYKWRSEESLQIDYLTQNKKLSEFVTYIPPEDQLLLERILGGKISEYEEERKQAMQELDNE